MCRVWGITLLVVSGVGLFSGPQRAFAQACKDEVSMVEASKQDLLELVGTVKKESLPDFERDNHQKSVVSRLSIHLSMLDELVSCLQKAAQDASAPKADAEADKAQHDAAAKLLEKIQQERDAIKAAQDSKNAKPLVEKLDLAS